MVLNENYEISDGPYGLKIITMRGRCTASEQDKLGKGVITKFRIVTIPGTPGGVLKSLDGAKPTVERIRPTTMNKTYACVKIGALFNPFAPKQTAGPCNGEAILQFALTYHEVGGRVLP